MLDKCVDQTFAQTENTTTLVKIAWDLLPETSRSRFMMHFVVRYADRFASEDLSSIINSGISLENSDVDITPLVTNEACMASTNSRLLIDICGFNVDPNVLVNYVSGTIDRLDKSELMYDLFRIRKESLPRATALFQKLLEVCNISDSDMKDIIRNALIENPEIACELIDNAITNEGYAERFGDKDILIALIDLIETYQESVLSILKKVTLSTDCSEFWATTDACAILIDEIISMREKGITVENFFEELFASASENTIMALIPTVSSIETLIESLAIILRNRFDEDSKIISELDALCL